VQDARAHLTYIAEPLRHLAVPLTELTLDPSNARKHNERNLAAIAGSLKRFGQRFPIVVQRQGMVVRAGNGRLLAAKQLGWSHLACVVVDESEVEATAFAISDNRTSELAEWDDETLTRLLESLPLEMLEVTGFNQAELDDLIEELRPTEVQEDEVPEPPTTAISKPGDLWVLGEHRLLCGDSTKEADVARVLAGSRADLILTDPPYGVSYVGKTEQALEIANDGVEGLQGLLRPALGLAAANSRPGAVWYVAAPAGPQFAVFASVLEELKVWRQTLAWVKDSMVLGHSDYHYKHEAIFYGWTPGAEHQAPPDRTRTSVLEFARPKASREHPTMKPLPLWAELLGNSSKRGGIVYDPFSGSGTTLLACEQLGRKCRTIEIEPRYADVAVIRWQQLTGKDAVLEGDGRTFAELSDLRNTRNTRETAKPLTDRTDERSPEGASVSSGTSHKRETPALAGVGGKS